MKSKRIKQIIIPETSENRVPLTVRQKVYALITYLCRFAVGILFIYSGFVKGIDPWGTIYKLREYVATMHTSWLMSQVTAATFLLFTFEFTVGIALVTGSYRRWAPRLATLFIAFMLPLTLWIAVADPVADCGCFGDALILSNWATFWKNVVLMALSLWLLWHNHKIRCIIIPTLQVWSFCASATYIILIGMIGYSIQPLLDYRPYPAGETLTDSGSSDGFEYLAIWTDGTNNITIPADSIPDDEKWEFVERKSVGLDKDESKIKGLTIYDGLEDVTEDVLMTDGAQVILMFPSLREVSIAHYYKLNSLYDYAQKHGIDMIAIAAGDSLQVATFRDFSLAQYPIYTAEDTAIKEVVRGNPAVVYTENGKILWKNSFNAIDTDDFMKDNPENLRVYERDDKLILRSISTVYVIVIVFLIFLSHIPMFIRRLKSKIRKPAVFALLLLLLCGMSACHRQEPSNPVERHKLSVLVYMVASNNLSFYSNLDFQEMMAGIEKCNADDIDLLVYSVQRDEAPQLLRISRHGTYPAEKTVLKTYADDGKSLTGARVSQVINDALSLSKADYYGLYLWSHASNWVPAQSPAYSFGDDKGRQMNITDLAAAIPSGIFSFVWMDCCLMGSAEVAYQFRNKCNYFVASPTELLAIGSPYQYMLPALLATPGLPIEAARQSYEYFSENSDVSMRQFTISVTKTSELPDVADACRRIAYSGKLADIAGLQKYGNFSGVTFYDLCQAYTRMTSYGTPEAEALRQALDRAVVYKAATPRCLGIPINPETYSGLSVTLLNLLTNTNQIDYYHEIDWYKAVYSE